MKAIEAEKDRGKYVTTSAKQAKLKVDVAAYMKRYSQYNKRVHDYNLKVNRLNEIQKALKQMGR